MKNDEPFPSIVHVLLQCTDLTIAVIVYLLRFIPKENNETTDEIETQTVIHFLTSFHCLYPLALFCLCSKKIFRLYYIYSEYVELSVLRHYELHIAIEGYIIYRVATGM